MTKGITVLYFYVFCVLWAGGLIYRIKNLNLNLPLALSLTPSNCIDSVIHFFFSNRRTIVSSYNRCYIFSNYRSLPDLYQFLMSLFSVNVSFSRLLSHSVSVPNSISMCLSACLSNCLSYCHSIPPFLSMFLSLCLVLVTAVPLILEFTNILKILTLNVFFTGYIGSVIS